MHQRVSRKHIHDAGLTVGKIVALRRHVLQIDSGNARTTDIEAGYGGEDREFANGRGDHAFERMQNAFGRAADLGFFQ